MTVAHQSSQLPFCLTPKSTTIDRISSEGLGRFDLMMFRASLFVETVRSWSRNAATTHDFFQADFPVDLLHTLGVSLRETYTAEQNVHFLEREALGLWEEPENEEGTQEGQDSEEQVRA